MSKLFFSKGINPDLNNEYQFFLESEPHAPPLEISRSIKSNFHLDLNPPSWKVFCKLFVIHFVSGAITLFFCPQLGVSLHGEGNFLFYLFSRFGVYGCELACGSLFLGVTGLMASLFLAATEIRVIRRTLSLQWALLAFLSLGTFLSFREAETSLPATLVIAWVVGAFLGGFFTFRLGWYFRNLTRRYQLS